MTETSQAPDTSGSLPTSPPEGDAHIEQGVQVEVAEKRKDIPMNELLRLGRLIEADRYAYNRQTQNRARQDGVPFVPSDTDLLNDHACLLEVVQILETNKSDSEDTVRTTYHLTQETIRVICDAYGIQLAKQEAISEPGSEKAEPPKNKTRKKRTKERSSSSGASAQEGAGEPQKTQEDELGEDLGDIHDSVVAGQSIDEDKHGAHFMQQPEYIEATGEQKQSEMEHILVDTPEIPTDYRVLLRRLEEKIVEQTYDLQDFQALAHATPNNNAAQDVVNSLWNTNTPNLLAAQYVIYLPERCFDTAKSVIDRLLEEGKKNDVGLIADPPAESGATQVISDYAKERLHNIGQKKRSQVDLATKLSHNGATPATSEATTRTDQVHDNFILLREELLGSSYNEALIENIKILGRETRNAQDARQTVQILLTMPVESDRRRAELIQSYIASIWDIQSAEAALDAISGLGFEGLHYWIACVTQYESTALCAAKKLKTSNFVESFFKISTFSHVKHALVVQYLDQGNIEVIQMLSEKHLLREDNLQLVNTLHPEWIATQSAETTTPIPETATGDTTPASDAETSTGTPTLEVGEVPDGLEPLDPPMIYTGNVGWESNNHITSLDEGAESHGGLHLFVMGLNKQGNEEKKYAWAQLYYTKDGKQVSLEGSICALEDQGIKQIRIEDDTAPYVIYGQAQLFYKDEKPEVAFALQVCRKKNKDETQEPAPPQPKPPDEDTDPTEPVAAPAPEARAPESELNSFTLLKTRECYLPLEEGRWEEQYTAPSDEVVKWGVHHSDEGIRLWVYDPVDGNTPASGGALSRESEVIFKHGHFAVKGQIMDINGQEQAVIHLYQAKSTTAAADASSSNTEPPTDAAKDADTPKQPPQVPVAEVVVPPPVQSQEIHGLRKVQEPPQTEYELSRPAPPEDVTPFEPPFVIEDMVGFAKTDNYDIRLVCPGLSRLEVRVRNGKKGSSKEGQVMVDVLDNGSDHEYDLLAGHLVSWDETHTNDIDINIRNGGNKVAVWGRARFVEDGGAKKLIYSLEVGLVNQDDEINAKPKPIVDPTPAELANFTPPEATPAPPPEPALVDETPAQPVETASGPLSLEVGDIPDDLEPFDPPFKVNDTVGLIDPNRMKYWSETHREGHIQLSVSGISGRNRFSLLFIYLAIGSKNNTIQITGTVNVTSDQENYIVRVDNAKYPYVVYGKGRLQKNPNGAETMLFALEVCRKKGAKDITATTEPSIKPPTGDAKPAQQAQVPVREKVSTGASSQADLDRVQTEWLPAPQPDLFSKGLPKGLRKDGLSATVAYLEIPRLADGEGRSLHSYRLEMPESNLYFTMSYKPDTRETHMEWSNTAMGLKHEVEGVRYDPEKRLYYVSHGYTRDDKNRIVRIEFQPPDAENVGFVRAQDFQELPENKTNMPPAVRNIVQKGQSLHAVTRMTFQEYHQHNTSHQFILYINDRKAMLELIGETSELEWGLSNGSHLYKDWAASIDRLHDTRDYVGLVSVLYLLTDKEDVVYILRHFASDNQMEVFGDLIAGSDKQRAKYAVDVLIETGHTLKLMELIHRGAPYQSSSDLKQYANLKLAQSNFTGIGKRLLGR